MSPAAAPDLVERATWRALGARVDLLVREGPLDEARRIVQAVLDEVDATYSRFRPDSELMRLPPSADPTGAPIVSPLLARAVEAALDAALWTDGAVDPTVGHAMRVLGYDDDFSRLLEGRPRHVELRVVPVPGWRVVHLDAAARRLHVPRGVELDLGATGKGLAADLAAAAVLEGTSSAGVLVSLGGDLATAGSPPEGGWRVLTAEDSDTPPEAPGEIVAITHGAVATSSTTVRRWRAPDGVTVHHLIDPATGRPVEGPWRTATVAADTCLLANAAATAAIVKGAAGPAWLEANGLPGRLVGRDGDLLRVGGWPAAATEAA